MKLEECNELKRLCRQLQESKECEQLKDFVIKHKATRIDNPSIEREVDEIAVLGGWIYDMLNGIEHTSNKSMQKKIRKVLGYTFP